jgi:hypothetical protein
MVKNVLLTVLVMALVCFAGAPLAQAAPSQQRVAQAIVVNGQQVQGVTVIQDGGVQSYTCPAPQQYVAANQSSSGWACYDESTGTWLMHALPPQTATVYGQVPDYYDSGSTAYYGYPYAYPSYGYGYPFYGFYGAPFFGFGFGAGRGFNNFPNRFNNFHNFHNFHNFNNFPNRFNGHGAVVGRGFANRPFGHGPVGHGSFGHAPGGSFGHMGGAHFGGMGGGHFGGGGHMGGMGGGHFGGGGHMGGMGGGGHR